MSKPCSDPCAFLGFDIGGTKVAVCVADATGRILAKHRLASGGNSRYADVLPEMIATGTRLVHEAGLTLERVRACGVCAPGPLDIANGLMLKSPNMTWDRAPVRDDVARGLGLPVFLENDANGGVLAECSFGTARGCQDVIYLTMSTGVGGGIIAGGRLVQGTNGLAGELGHMVLDLAGPPCGCGMRGCLEAYCGGRSVATRLQERLRHEPDHPLLALPEVDGNIERLSIQALRSGAQAGIPFACDAWDEICLRLAQGIGLCLMAFNPRMVVLGTLAHYSGETLMAPVRAYLPRFAWPDMLENCTVAVTTLGPAIGELAGIAVARHGLHQAGIAESAN